MSQKSLQKYMHKKYYQTPISLKNLYIHSKLEKYLCKEFGLENNQVQISHKHSKKKFTQVQNLLTNTRIY